MFAKSILVQKIVYTSIYDIIISAKSNDITNMFVKSILVQKIVYTSIYDIIMSP